MQKGTKTVIIPGCTTYLHIRPQRFANEKSRPGAWTAIDLRRLMFEVNRLNVREVRQVRDQLRKRRPRQTRLFIPDGFWQE